MYFLLVGFSRKMLPIKVMSCLETFVQHTIFSQAETFAVHVECLERTDGWLLMETSDDDSSSAASCSSSLRMNPSGWLIIRLQRLQVTLRLLSKLSAAHRLSDRLHHRCPPSSDLDPSLPHPLRQVELSGPAAVVIIADVLPAID